MHAIKQQNVSKNKSKFSYQLSTINMCKFTENILLLCEFLNPVFYKVLTF